MKFLLSTFGLHNPYLEGELPDHGGYPVSAAADGGLDLDYTALLLGDAFLIDEKAYEEITSGARPFLGPMANTLRFLKKEGLVATADIGERVAPRRQKIIAKTEALLADPAMWLPEARTQWLAMGSELKEFHSKFGQPDRKLLNTCHFGVINYLRKRDSHLDEREIKRVTSLVTSTRRRKVSDHEQDEIRESLKPLVAQILLNELVRSEFNRPVLDWDDAKAFYDKLYLTQWDDADLEIELRLAARKLLDFTIPELKPANVEAVVKFVRDDRAVVSLREELKQLIASGRDVDAKWFVDYVNRAVKHDITVKGKVRKLRWLGAIAGAFIPGAGLVQEVVTNLGSEAIEGAVSDRLESSGTSRYHWYYALQKEAVRRN